MSFQKQFPIGESRRLEFRADMFNAFNHANFLFAQPGPQNSNNATVFGTPSFGYVTAARAPRRWGAPPPAGSVPAGVRENARVSTIKARQGPAGPRATSSS